MIYLPESNNEIIREAYERLNDDTLWLPDQPDTLENAMIKLNTGEVEAVICGIENSSADVLRTAIKIVGADGIVSSFFLMQKEQEQLIYADCAVIPNPSSGQLAEIAIQTATSARKIGIDPFVAFLSFSTERSSRTSEVEKIRDAILILDNKGVDFDYAGEWQFDTAYNLDIRRKKTNNKDQRKANIFIFPDLNSGNIAYKITEQLGSYTAVGPILQGLRKPVFDLSRGSTVEDVIQVIMISKEYT